MPLHPDNERILCEFADQAIKLMCGGNAILDTGSSFDVMNELIYRMKAMTKKERRKVRMLVTDPIAIAFWEEE